MSKTLDDKQQFIELRAKGYSFAHLALPLLFSEIFLRVFKTGS